MADLERGSPPMDRLVCGDVGFGKTEVALRAAAVAALNGQGWPCWRRPRSWSASIWRLSDAASPASTCVSSSSPVGRDKYLREVRQGLADGSVRIVIGTRALASPQLRLRDLGLVIIDEEQRFGTAQKAAWPACARASTC